MNISPSSAVLPVFLAIFLSSLVSISAKKCAKTGDTVTKTITCVAQEADKVFDKLEKKSFKNLKKAIKKCFPKKGPKECKFPKKSLKMDSFGKGPIVDGCSACFAIGSSIRYGYIRHETRSCWTQEFLDAVAEISKPCTNDEVMRTIDVDLGASKNKKRITKFERYLKVSMAASYHINECAKSGDEAQAMKIENCLASHKYKKNKIIMKSRKKCFKKSGCYKSAKSAVDLVCKCFVDKRAGLVNGMKELAKKVMDRAKEKGSDFDAQKDCIEFGRGELLKMQESGDKADWLDLFKKASECSPTANINALGLVVDFQCNQIANEAQKGKSFRQGLDMIAFFANSIMDRFANFCLAEGKPLK